MSVGNGPAKIRADLLGQYGARLVGGGIGGGRGRLGVRQAIGECTHRRLDAAEYLGAVDRQIWFGGGGTVAERRKTQLHVLEAIGVALVGVSDLACELVEKPLDVVGQVLGGRVFRAGCLRMVVRRHNRSRRHVGVNCTFLSKRQNLAGLT
jgi:hypothetical protein